MDAYPQVYDLLLDRAAAADDTVQEVLLGLTWTLCRSESAVGLAMSPAISDSLVTRRLPWPGTLAGRPLAELAGWLREWAPYKAAVGMAAVNAALAGSRSAAQLQAGTTRLEPGNLAVFEHFRPLLAGQVAVVGRYPGLDQFHGDFELTVLERQPGSGDLPDPAAEYVLPEADWVFLTASSLTNKTFPRLAELACDANLVLMGPTTPWLAELGEFGVDFLAGVSIADPATLRTTVSEGGGMRIFDQAVRYAVADLGAGEMERLKEQIADVARQRQHLKEEMNEWYSGTRQGSFPRRSELDQLDNRLSALDSRYKRHWDARFGRSVRPLNRDAA